MLPTSSYSLWDAHDVLGGLWWWTWEDKFIPIKDFISVRLKGGVFIVGPVTAEIRVNDYPVWTQFELIQGLYAVDVDVSQYIYDHADNKFSIGVSPMGGATFTITATVEYTEEPPGPPEPPPVDPWKWLRENWMWVGLGVGGIVFVALVWPKAPPVYVVRGEQR